MDMTLWFRLLLAIGIGLIAANFLLGRPEKKAHISWLKDDAVKEEPKSSWYNEVLTTLSTSLSYKSKDIKEKFIAAGYYEARFYWLYLPVKVAFISAVLLSCFVFYDFWGLGSFNNRLSIAAVALVAIILVPDMVLAAKRKLLVRRTSERLPYLLDLMAVCVQTGMTIEATFSYLAIEMRSFDRDLAFLLKKTNDRAQVVGLEKALDELLLRVPSNEMRSFVNTLKQSMKYGSSIYEVLTTLAKDIREVHMLGLEEKIGKLSSKMSVPLILLIMFPIVILITAPGIMRLMANA